MGKISELHSVETPVTEWLRKMGWTFQHTDDLKIYNRPFSNPIIESILVERTASINGISTAIAKAAVESLVQHLNNPSPILGNEAFLEKLASHVTLSVDGNDIDICFVDFDNIWENSFIVTNQYWAQGYKMVKADIVLLVNGIPLVFVQG